MRMGNLRQMQKFQSSSWTFFSCSLYTHVVLSVIYDVQYSPIFCISSFMKLLNIYIFYGRSGCRGLTTMSLLVLSLSDVDAITSTFSPQDLQLLMADVFALISSKDPRQRVSMPPRIVIPTLHHTALFMPAHIGSTGLEPVFALGGTAVKVVCVPAESDPRGLPATTLVLDEVTGSVKAVVNARNLTALRNAAGPYTKTSNLFEFGLQYFKSRFTPFHNSHWTIHTKEVCGFWSWETDRSASGPFHTPFSFYFTLYRRQSHYQCAIQQSERNYQSSIQSYKFGCYFFAREARSGRCSAFCRYHHLCHVFDSSPILFFVGSDRDTCYIDWQFYACHARG